MGILKIGMINAVNYKIIEDFVATIYSTDIYDFGNKSYYPQILKIISSVNLRGFKGDEIVCDNDIFCNSALGTNINAVARGLNLPRETTRRKVEELIKLKWVFRFNSELYVTQKWREINFSNINSLLEKVKKISRAIEKEALAQAEVA